MAAFASSPLVVENRHCSSSASVKIFELRSDNPVLLQSLVTNCNPHGQKGEVVGVFILLKCVQVLLKMKETLQSITLL